MYYPIFASVFLGNHILGYLSKWLQYGSSLLSILFTYSILCLNLGGTSVIYCIKYDKFSTKKISLVHTKLRVCGQFVLCSKPHYDHCIFLAVFWIPSMVDLIKRTRV